MAASLWTIVVLVEENPSLNKTFQMLPDNKLAELEQAWKDECGVFGSWSFMSADEQTIYNHDWTLEMIGESIPHSRIITLKAESIDEPAPLMFREIFVYLNEECHRLFVTPDEKVGEVMWRVPGSPEYLEFNGEPVNLKHTVEQAGLQDKSVLYQRLCSVTVKLSSGYSRIFQIPLDSRVWHLIETINGFETEEFSLKYEGRFLKPDEGVRHLTKIVEVRRAEFVVHVDGRRISWKAKEEPIPVSDFLPQLMLKGEIDAKRLEEMEFVCMGCQRRIRNSQDDMQFLPVECCGVRSMTLDAMVPSETRLNSDSNDLTKHIQVLQELLERCRLQGSCVEGSRCVCRELKQKFTAEGLDYNVLTQNSQSLLKRINDLEDKMQKLNVVIEASEKEIGRLQTENLKIKEENRELFDKNKNLDKENRVLVSLMKDPKGATAVGPPRLPATPTEQLGVKLFVSYDARYFSPVAGRPELQSQGQFLRLGFIRCLVGKLWPGWVAFEEVRDALRPLFTGPWIARIYQCRGLVDGRPVAVVTSPADDEEVSYSFFGVEFFCSSDGRESRAGEVKEDNQDIREGGRVFIAGGQRRTVLEISKS